MASGTGNLPNQNMDFTPFDILTAEEMDDLVENIESLADGTGIGDASVKSGKLAENFFRGIYQSDANNSISNSQPTNLTIQFGWGQRAGNNTGSMTEEVTFPTPFSEILYLDVKMLGITTTDSTPAASITDTETQGSGIVVAPQPISNDGFTVNFNQISGNMASTRYFLFSWMAIGNI